MIKLYCPAGKLSRKSGDIKLKVSDDKLTSYNISPLLSPKHSTFFVLKLKIGFSIDILTEYVHSVGIND